MFAKRARARSGKSQDYLVSYQLRNPRPPENTAPKSINEEVGFLLRLMDVAGRHADIGLRSPLGSSGPFSHEGLPDPRSRPKFQQACFARLRSLLSHARLYAEDERLLGKRAEHAQCQYDAHCNQ